MLTFLGKFRLNKGIWTINCKVLTRPHKNYKLADKKTLDSITVETTEFATDLICSFASLIFYERASLEICFGI